MSKCWNCADVISEENLFCTSCSIIQPPAPVDHFKRFGIEHRFEVDPKKLESAYFALQTQLHPDRFARKSEKEKIFSMQQSIDVNAAYETLKDTLARAEYILKLQGIIVNADNSTVKPSQAVLLEIMEAQERLMEMRLPEDVKAFAVETSERKNSVISALRDNFAQGNLEYAAQNTITLKYLEKLNEEIKKR